MIRIYVDSLYEPEINWVLNLVAWDQKFNWKAVSRQDADLVIGHGKEDNIRVSKTFFQKILQNQTRPDIHFDQDLMIRNEWGEEDPVSTIFYLVNSLQEYDHPESGHDKYGRFPYTASLQYEFGITEKNYVGELIARFMQLHPVLADFTLKNPGRSKIYLSHDIDSVHGSWKTDGKWALKRGHLLQAVNIFIQTVLFDPPWFNMDRIMKMHSEYDMRSTFYWIMSHGLDKYGIQNGDYSVMDKNIRDQIIRIKENGFGTGIHKSSLDSGFSEELMRSPVKIRSNRYHYLKFSIPEAYEDMENSGIRLDTSLGFAERSGFRNSYGRPFKPYNMEERRAYDLVELPLNIMDASFVYYQNVRKGQVYTQIRDFIEKNRTNTILNILWHNDELSPYYFGDMLENYKQLLVYLYENKFETLLEEDILALFDHVDS